MLPDFASIIAETKEEALSCLSSLERAKVIAGGTDLMVKMRSGERYDHIIDITNIRELDGIAVKDGVVVIGPVATHARLGSDAAIRENAPGLALACSLVGSPQIRNMGTIGGNIVNASPAADSIPPMLIHDAMLTLESKGSSRKVRLEDIIVAPYKTSINTRELLGPVEITSLKGYREGYTRVAKRAAWAISRLSVAWAIREEEGTFRDVKLAIGSCTPMPFRAVKVEGLLRGEKRQPGIIAEAVRMALEEIKLISGIRPSFAYKLPVLRGILENVLGGE